MRRSKASGGRAPTLKIITAMYSTAGMFVVRGDSAARTIGDLKGKPVAFGAKGSGLTILSRYVLDGLGLDQNKDFQAIFLDKAGDGPAMVLDGRAAALWGGGVGWPGFAAVARSRRPLHRADAGRSRSASAPSTVSLKAPRCPPAAIPGRSAGGRTRSAPGASCWRGRRLPTTSPMRWPAPRTKATRRLPSAWRRRAETTPQNTAAAAPRPELIHPGVRKYLREIGAGYFLSVRAT